MMTPNVHQSAPIQKCGDEVLLLLACKSTFISSHERKVTVTLAPFSLLPKLLFTHWRARLCLFFVPDAPLSRRFSPPLRHHPLMIIMMMDPTHKQIHAYTAISLTALLPNPQTLPLSLVLGVFFRVGDMEQENSLCKCHSGKRTTFTTSSSTYRVLQLTPRCFTTASRRHYWLLLTTNLIFFLSWYHFSFSCAYSENSDVASDR